MSICQAFCLELGQDCFSKRVIPCVIMSARRLNFKSRKARKRKKENKKDQKRKCLHYKNKPHGFVKFNQKQNPFFKGFLYKDSENLLKSIFRL